MKQGLSMCKNTTPGPDIITAPNHMMEKSLKVLLGAFNVLWEDHKIPTFLEKKTKLPFSKPNKDPTEVGNNRLLSHQLCLQAIW